MLAAARPVGELGSVPLSAALVPSVLLGLPVEAGDREAPIELLSKARSSELLLNTLRPPSFRRNVVARGETKQAGPQEVGAEF